MAQSGFTPISLYYSATTTNVPLAGNLVNGELAINTADGKLFYKDSGGAVQTLAYKNVPVSTLAGLGTGVATALAVNIGTSGSPVVNGGALGTPSSGTVTNLTGTASININGTVGATTPAAGAFTTIAASGAVTLSGGTANGVAYLNGSKVLTTGSALTFDGTNFATTGRGNFGQRVQVTGNTAPTTGTGLELFYDGTAAGSLGFARGTGYIPNVMDGSDLRFFTSSSEQMRLTSTGLGIGTSSPATNAKLHVYATGDFTDESAPFTLGSSAAGGMRLYSGVNNTSEYSYIGSVKSGTRYASLVLQPNGGNLGLGVTPSAWNTNYRSIEMSYGSLTGNITGVETDLTSNAYRATDGSYYYKKNGVAGMFTISDGSGRGMTWYTAASGTAGNAISFTQAMTLDASGNLLVGQTGTGLQAARSFSWQGVGDGSFYVSHSTANASGDPYMRFGYNGGQIGSITQAGTTAVLYNTTSDYRLKTNVEPLTSALDKVQALKPSEFDWIDGRHDDGFLAHELQAVLPNLVTGNKDAVNKDGTPKYQQVDYARIVPTLTAAIQEQQALITQLQADVADVAALKGN